MSSRAWPRRLHEPVRLNLLACARPVADATPSSCRPDPGSTTNGTAGNPYKRDNKAALRCRKSRHRGVPAIGKKGRHCFNIRSHRMVDRRNHLRQELHAIPNLGTDEVAHAPGMSINASRMGYRVHRGLGGTGVVAFSRQATGPKAYQCAFSLRADMPRADGYRHSATEMAHRPFEDAFTGCGHDATPPFCWAPRAISPRPLAIRRPTVHSIFQPAEESANERRTVPRNHRDAEKPLPARIPDLARCTSRSCRPNLPQAPSANVTVQAHSMGPDHRLLASDSETPSCEAISPL